MGILRKKKINWNQNYIYYKLYIFLSERYHITEPICIIYIDISAYQHCPWTVMVVKFSITGISRHIRECSTRINICLIIGNWREADMKTSIQVLAVTSPKPWQILKANNAPMITSLLSVKDHGGSFIWKYNHKWMIHYFNLKYKHTQTFVSSLYNDIY